MANDIILESRDISKKFGDFTAIDNVSYQLMEGETAGIIGPNGAGKSTFFNLLTGLFPPSEGEISFLSQNVTPLGAEKRVALGLVRTFQLVSVFNSLPVLDNLILASVRFSFDFTNKFKFLFGSHRKKQMVETCMDWLERVGIANKAETNTAELSYGDKRKLEIAMALILKPKVLLLDEPLAGLSDVEIFEVINLVREVKEELTLVIIEHKISRITDIVSRLNVLHEGRIIAEGTPEQVLNDSEVRRVYWGENSK
jgi:branched-chain amino acid transport system ATP-binding protein